MAVSPTVHRLAALAFVATGATACAACGDDHHSDPQPTGAGGAGSVSSTGPTTSSSVSTTTTTTTGGGGDNREWKPLEWEGLPCAIQVAEPTATPTLTWKPCTAPGCQVVDPSPFFSGSAAIGGAQVSGEVVTAMVRRFQDVYDAVVWSAATGHERFAFRGHTDCFVNRLIPFVHQGEERGWLVVTSNDVSLLTSANYEFAFDDLSSATKLDIPSAWLTQEAAGDAAHLALESIPGPIVGIWSRATNSFTSLGQISFEPRVGAGGVLFQSPNAQNELDGLWWKDDALSTAIASTPGLHVENPWIVGSKVVWTEGTLGGTGVAKRASFDSASLPVTSENVTPVQVTARGGASERFYVILDQGTPEKLHVVNLDTDALTVITLPEEMFWPSSVEYVGVDPFGPKQVAWVRENKTIYRIELE